MTNLLSRPLLMPEDHTFFRQLINSSPDWQHEECSEADLNTYLKSYKMYNGEWKVWSDGNNSLIGISYILEWSPANEKPWLGTILVHPDIRLNGYGKEIINHISHELKQKGHRALFAACPILKDHWLQFLGKCGFEQFKVELDQHPLKEFMITVRPLR